MKTHHFHTKLPYQKPMLRQIDWWGQNGPITKKRILSVITLFVWIFIFSLKPLIKNWSDVPTTQMSVFLLFVSAAVLFDGAFSLWVSKYSQSSNWKFVKAGVSQVSVLRLLFCWWYFLCVKSVQIRSFFWSVFSCIRTGYGGLRSKSPYPVRIQENTDQKKLRIWTLFTQCSLFLIANFAQASASVLKSNLLKYRIGYINGRYRFIQNELNKRKWLYFWERSIRFFIHLFTLTMQLLISRMHRSTLALS